MRPDHRLAVRVLAVAEQGPHLLLGHLLPGQPEQRRAAADPRARRVAVGRVIPGGVLARLPGHVTARDLPGQVGVAVPGGQLVDGHHHRRCPPPATVQRPMLTQVQEVSCHPSPSSATSLDSRLGEAARDGCKWGAWGGRRCWLLDVCRKSELKSGTTGFTIVDPAGSPPVAVWRTGTRTGGKGSPMARRGSSARAAALRRAQQAKADRDAARLAREKDIEAALADYFEAIGRAEQIRREARRKADRLLATAELAARAPLQAAGAAVCPAA